MQTLNTEYTPNCLAHIKSYIPGINIIFPLSVILFLYSGLYKNISSSMIDLTILTLSIVLICLFTLFRKQNYKQILLNPVFILFVLLEVYLAIRLIPAFNPWGVRKIAEGVLLGIPAMLAGVAISRSPELFRRFLVFLCFFSYPVSLYVIFYSLSHSPYDFSSFGYAGYQLTGSFLAVCAIAALVLKRNICFGIILLALFICGYIPGAIFILPIFFITNRITKISISKGIATAVFFIVVYSLLIACPLTLNRVICKTCATVIILTHKSPYTLSSNESLVFLKSGGAGIGGKLLADLTKQTTGKSSSTAINVDSANRIDIYKAAFEAIRNAPVLGGGYGNINYAGYRNSHNVIIDLFAEAGAIAGILGLLIVGLSGKYAINSNHPFIIAYWLFIIVAHMFGGNWETRCLCFAFGLAIGSTFLKKEIEYDCY